MKDHRGQIAFVTDPASLGAPGSAIIARIPEVSTKEQLFVELERQLEFPEWGHNWDALYDWLSRLHWLNERSVLIVHVGIPRLAEGELRTYLGILLDVHANWISSPEHEFVAIFPESAANRLDELQLSIQTKAASGTRMTANDWDTFVRAELKGQCLCSGSYRYPSVQAMYEALDEVAARGFEVIGLEGLNTDGIHVIPSLDHISNFSSIVGSRSDRVEQSVAAARMLLKRWEGGVQFVDVVVADGTSEREESSATPR
jgi:hypothetical protein